MAEGGDSKRKGWRDLEELVLWSTGWPGPLSRGVEGERGSGGEGAAGVGRGDAQEGWEKSPGDLS